MVQSFPLKKLKTTIPHTSPSTCSNCHCLILDLVTRTCTYAHTALSFGITT